MTDSGVPLELLLDYVERAAPDERKLLVQLFRQLYRLTRLPNAPPEERKLGEILCRILMSDRQPT